MLSSAGLGQNPFAPTTALERAEIAEDRAVRQGIERLQRRHGEAADSDSDSGEERRGKGKGRAVEVLTTASGQDMIETTVLETKAERKAREKAEARGSNGKLQMRKKVGLVSVMGGLTHRRTGIPTLRSRKTGHRPSLTHQIRAGIVHRRMSRPRSSPLRSRQLPQHLQRLRVRH